MQATDHLIVEPGYRTTKFKPCPNWKPSQTTISLFHKWCNFSLIGMENIEGKGENAAFQHFLLFPQCFQKASFSGS